MPGTQGPRLGTVVIFHTQVPLQTSQTGEVQDWDVPATVTVTHDSWVSYLSSWGPPSPDQPAEGEFWIIYPQYNNLQEPTAAVVTAGEGTGNGQYSYRDARL
jgi:hypothetical protein